MPHLFHYSLETCFHALHKYRHTLEMLQVRFQSTAEKQVTQICWFPSAYKSYGYARLESIKYARNTIIS